VWIGVHEQDVQSGELHVIVYDNGEFHDEDIGKATVPLSEIPHDTPREFEIKLKHGELLHHQHGAVFVRMHFAHEPNLRRE